jgi:hypothetical protein
MKKMRSCAESLLFMSVALKLILIRKQVLLRISQPQANLFRRSRSVWTFDNCPESHFKEIFRFYKKDIQVLYELMEIPIEINLGNRTRMSGIDAFCITLYRLAHSGNLVVMQDYFQRSGSTISRCVKVLFNIYSSVIRIN